MIKLFEKYEEGKYTIIKILFIKITLKKKSPIDTIAWWIPFRSLRNAVRNIYYEYKNNFNITNDNNLNTIYLKRYLDYLEMAKIVNKKAFLNYRNKYSNKEIVLIGNGPTAIKYGKNIKDAIHIGVNRAFLLKNIKLDYLFIQDNNNAGSIFEDVKKYTDESCIKFYGIVDGNHYNVSMTIPDSYINEVNAIKYIVNPIDFLSDMQYEISIFPLGDFGTVSFSAMQFIFWTNPKKIYLVGLDSNNNGHFYNNKSGLDVNRIMRGWDRIKYLRENFYPATEIISINPVGLKGIFIDIYTENGNYYTDENGNKINI